MYQYITQMFENMSLLTGVLLGAGLLLCIIEVFVPKIGLTGLFGIILLGLGISSYYIDGYKLKFIIGILSIVAIVLAIFIVIELILEAKGIIKNPNRYQLRIPQQSLNSLIGKVGKAYTNIDLGGTIDIDGKLYYAIATSSIESGTFVEVIDVQNNSLVVVKK